MHYTLRGDRPGTMILKRGCPSKQCKVDKFSFIFFGTFLLAAVLNWLMEYSRLIKQAHLGKGATESGVGCGASLVLPWHSLQKRYLFNSSHRYYVDMMGVRILMKDVGESNMKERRLVSGGRKSKSGRPPLGGRCGW